MVTREIKAYPCLQSFVTWGITFSMTEIEVTEGYGSFSNMATWSIHVCKVFEKLPCNPHFSQI